MPLSTPKLIIHSARLSKATKSDKPADKLPRHWRVLSVHDSVDGRLRAVDYQHDSGHVITTFRCTDRWENVVKDDFHLFWKERLHPECIEFAEAQMARVKTSYAKETHSWNGYSLGGGMAEYCGIKTGHRTFVQDSSGMGKELANEWKDANWSAIHAVVAAKNDINQFATHYIPVKNITHLPGEKHEIEIILDTDMGRRIKLPVTTGPKGRDSHDINDIVRELSVLLPKEANHEKTRAFMSKSRSLLTKPIEHLKSISHLTTEKIHFNALKNLAACENRFTPAYSSQMKSSHELLRQPLLADRISFRIEPRLPSTIETLMGPPVKLSDVAEGFCDNHNPRARELFKNAKICK